MKRYFYIHTNHILCKFQKIHFKSDLKEIQKKFKVFVYLDSAI